MALYLPRIFPGEPAHHMVADAGALLAAAGYGEDRPWVKLGIGLDFGTAFVGNVGSGDVKDFTAIGNVVTTAARLQAAAASGEIVMSSRVHDRAGEHAAGAEPRELSMKGKSEPEIAMVRHIDFAMPPADAQAGSWRRQGETPGSAGREKTAPLGGPFQNARSPKSAAPRSEHRVRGPLERSGQAVRVELHPPGPCGADRPAQCPRASASSRRMTGAELMTGSTKRGADAEHAGRGRLHAQPEERTAEVVNHETARGTD